jgi:DNA mismatch endonuclease, patch repair protein
MNSKKTPITLLAVDPLTSARMKCVRQSGTAPEIEVGKLLRRIGVFYRLQNPDLAGKPDFANRCGKWAIFVNGCFWHGHTGCVRSKVPTKNRDYWLEKIKKNRSRDAKCVRALRAKGFTVLIVWECESRKHDLVLAKLRRLPVGLSSCLC